MKAGGARGQRVSVSPTPVPLSLTPGSRLGPKPSTSEEGLPRREPPSEQCPWVLGGWAGWALIPSPRGKSGHRCGGGLGGGGASRYPPLSARTGLVLCLMGDSGAHAVVSCQ